MESIQKCRSIVAIAIQSNRAKYEPYLSGGMTIEKKKSLIKTLGEWGGELEIAAFSSAMKSKINVYKDGTLHSVYQPETFSREVELLYLNENHYDMLLEEGIPVVGECIQINVPEFPSDAVSQSQSLPQEPTDSKQETDTDDQLISQTDEILNSEEMTDDPSNERTLTSLLQKEFLTRESTLQWLTENGVFPSTMNCPNPSCGGGQMIRWTTIKGRPDGDFYCPKCQCRRSIRGNTIFRSLHLSPELFCQIVIH